MMRFIGKNIRNFHNFRTERDILTELSAALSATVWLGSLA
jgi:hypothetical protein